MNDKSGTQRQKDNLGHCGVGFWFRVSIGRLSVDLSGRALPGAASKTPVTHLWVTSMGALSPDRQLWGWIGSWLGELFQEPSDCHVPLAGLPARLAGLLQLEQLYAQGW